MNLQLSLKRKWFEMTKAGIKTEDYRNITPYWITRLLNCEYPEERKGENKAIPEGIIFDIENGHTPSEVIRAYFCKFRPFETNTMTLGYPKSTDTDRILKLEHKGIEIREGRQEWGAEPGKLYFVILHGHKIEK